MKKIVLGLTVVLSLIIPLTVNAHSSDKVVTEEVGLQEEGINYPNLIDENQVEIMYGVTFLTAIVVGFILYRDVELASEE